MKNLRFSLVLAGPVFASFVALGSIAAPVSALAQSAGFTVSQNGKQVGTASYKFVAVQGGYTSESLVNVSMQGLNYALSKTERLDSANRLKHVLASGIVNGSAVNITAKPDTASPGTSSLAAANLLLNISANGRSSTTRLDAHAGAVFLADFDPGALQTLLALCVTQRGSDLWAVIPKQAGSVAQVTVATDGPEQGTLNGKPVAVQHLTATINGAKTEIFAGPKNDLLQAELPEAGFALVRNGFVLTPPKTAGALPADAQKLRQQMQQDQQQQQQAPQQQQYPQQQYPAQPQQPQNYPQQPQE
jgi:hypothetical protein